MYVDNILVTGSDTVVISALVTSINITFAPKDSGELNYFLGAQVTHTDQGVHEKIHKKISFARPKCHLPNPFLHLCLMDLDSQLMEVIQLIMFSCTSPLLGHYSMLLSLGLRLSSVLIKCANSCKTLCNHTGMLLNELCVISI